MKPDVQEIAAELARSLRRQIKLRTAVTVQVWYDGEDTSGIKVEMYLDETFTLDKLSLAGTALQRGTYEAFEQAVRDLLLKEP